MKTSTRLVFASFLALGLGGAAPLMAQTPLQVGVVRPYQAETPHPYRRGDRGLPVVWADRVISPGAAFVRVHFSGLSLAEGDFVTVADRNGSPAGTYAGKGPRGDGDLWSFAVAGDTAVVELHSGRGNGFGYRIDAVGHGTVPLSAAAGPAPIPEVICGTDGREDVACHLGDPIFNAAQRPVARLLFVSGPFLFACTGWLVDGANDSTLVTNNHCINTQKETDTLQASFNFQRADCGGAIDATAASYAGGTLLRTNTVNRHGHKGGLDYTLLTLSGSPEATWGRLIPTTRPAVPGDPIWFIQHGGGNEKQVGFYDDAAHTQLCNVDSIGQTYAKTSIGSQTAYACDSEGGSSGSPIIDPATGHVIALHHFGGVDTSPCLNSGTAMADICADAGALLNCAAN